MASKSIDWDEILVTQDPKKKEVGVTFVKVDGYGSPSGDSVGNDCPPGTFKHYNHDLVENGGFERVNRTNIRITDVEYPDFIDSDFFIYVSREEARPFAEYVDVSFEPRPTSPFPWTEDKLPKPVKVLIEKGQRNGKLEVKMPDGSKWSENPELYPPNQVGLYYPFDIVINSPACDSRALTYESPCSEAVYVLPAVEIQGRRPFLLSIDVCDDERGENPGGSGGTGGPVPGDNDECLDHDCTAFQEVNLGGLLVGYVQGAPLWEQTTTPDAYGTYRKLISPNNGTYTGIAAQQPYWAGSPISYDTTYYWSHLDPDNGGAGVICDGPDLFAPLFSGTQNNAVCPSEVLDATNNLADHFWPEANTLANIAAPLDRTVYPLVGAGQELSSNIEFTQTIVVSPEGVNAPGPTNKCAVILCRSNPMIFRWLVDFNNSGTFGGGGNFNWAEGYIQLLFYGDGRITCKKRTPSNTVSDSTTTSGELQIGTWDPNLVGIPIVVTMTYSQDTTLIQQNMTGLFKIGVSIRQGPNSANAVHNYTNSYSTPNYTSGEAFAYPAYKAMTPATNIGWVPTQARCGFVYTTLGAVGGDFALRLLAAIGGDETANLNGLTKLLRSFTTYTPPTYCERIP